MKDVVVLLPGITGSVLVDAKGDEIWGTSAGSIWRTIKSGGGNIESLALGADPDGVTATRLIPDATIIPGLIKIDGYSRTEDFLVRGLNLSPHNNYFAFPYDWRLDNRTNAKRLETTAMQWLNAWRASSGNTDARLVFIGHSMGGLVARYFLECLGGWQHTRTLITVGTPHRGSLNAVDFLIHGLKKGIGPFGVDLTPMLRSFPSVYQLLPTYPCIEFNGTDELARIEDAARAGSLPSIRADRAAEARKFHSEIVEAQEANSGQTRYIEQGYRLIPVVGFAQPTYQSALVATGSVSLLRTYQGEDMGGDGTVPRVSATPIELSREEREIYAAETHGSLQNADGVLTNIIGLLTRPDFDSKRFRGEQALRALTLDLSEVVLPGEPLIVRARSQRGTSTIQAHLTNINTGESFTRQLERDPVSDWQALEVRAHPGTWRVSIVESDSPPVTDLAVVAES